MNPPELARIEALRVQLQDLTALPAVQTYLETVAAIKAYKEDLEDLARLVDGEGKTFIAFKSETFFVQVTDVEDKITYDMRLVGKVSPLAQMPMVLSNDAIKSLLVTRTQLDEEGCVLRRQSQSRKVSTKGLDLP